MSSTTDYDPIAFRAFELEGWERLGSGYQQWFTELTSQAAEALLSGTNVIEGSTVLDVATGPGIVARAAVDRGAKATGVDFSESVVQLARQACPAVDFQHADAEALPFAEDNFDAVVINFGMLHFPDPEKALAEAHRVLRPSGRLGFTNWVPPGETAIGIALRAIGEHGSFDVALPEGTDMFRFADALECRRVLSEIGFEEATSIELPLSWRFTSPDDLIVAFVESTPRSGGLLKAQTSGALQSIRNAMRNAVLKYERNGVYEVPMPAMLTTATKI